MAALRSYRTVCANGKQHAVYSRSVTRSERERASEVVAYDDSVNECGPHTAERSDDNGFTWEAI